MISEKMAKKWLDKFYDNDKEKNEILDSAIDLFINIGKELNLISEEKEDDKIKTKKMHYNCDTEDWEEVEQKEDEPNGYDNDGNPIRYSMTGSEQKDKPKKNKYKTPKRVLDYIYDKLSGDDEY